MRVPRTERRCVIISRDMGGPMRLENHEAGNALVALDSCAPLLVEARAEQRSNANRMRPSPLHVQGAMPRLHTLSKSRTDTKALDLTGHWHGTSPTCPAPGGFLYRSAVIAVPSTVLGVFSWLDHIPGYPMSPPGLPAQHLAIADVPNGLVISVPLRPSIVLLVYLSPHAQSTDR